MRALGATALSLALAACATLPGPSMTADEAPVTVRIVGLNDFHGNLEPVRRPVKLEDGKGGQQEVFAGGAAWLASAVESVRAQNPHSLVIGAGDLISASPLASSLFLDEPTVGVMNRLGMDFTSVGNHEFDRGWKELKRLREGGCEKFTLREPCAVEPDYKGTDYPILAANVRMPDGSTLFPGAAIRRFGSGAGAGAVAVGVIGLTLKGTAQIVDPAGIQCITFEDEADSINALVPGLVADGADAIVVAIHQGLVTEPGDDFNGCGAMAGDLRAILERMDPRVDLVISGHTHRAYVCDFSTVDPARRFTVTSAGAAGTMLTDIALTIDPRRGDVLGVSARNVPVQSPGEGRPENAAFPVFQPDPAVATYVARYVAAAAEVAERTVGRISGAATRERPESPLGNFLADAHLAATQGAGAQIALMNPGGIRSELTARPDGSVTFGDIYGVQPFGNTLVTMTLTGAQLLRVLEEQLANPNEQNVLSVSTGFAMTLAPTRPAGQRVVAATLGGVPIDPAGTYRVTVNNFIAGGGDGFVTLKEGTDATVGPLDLDALEAYLQSAPVMAMPATGRVTMLGS
ncbi:bifunctional metallophosphatase/5'-nucleotidase [Altererythrobacter aerius]|uniref:Bifunctional metallophosphatase/5'-nucleotidase n=1 Tax=Tsuneonella aeria TaxID=1837929 RepID=A0A6I4TDJ8_9SPHN|nr:bifunctional metallophosphatase/5'-nucleotidase [Tsuneonella aeria]